MSIYLLTKNINELFTNTLNMSGGKINNINNSINNNKISYNIFITFILVILSLILRGIIVYCLYNYLVPRIIYSLSENKSLETIESNFKKINLTDSILLVIFTTTLFSLN